MRKSHLLAGLHRNKRLQPPNNSTITKVVTTAINSSEDLKTAQNVPSDNDSGTVKLLTDNVHDFVASTSLHGVRYIGEVSRHPVERVLWLVLVVIFAVLGGIEVAKVWMRWQSNPVVVSFTQSQSNVASIPMPVITICTETRVRKSVVDLDSNFNDLQRKLQGKQPFNSPGEQLMAEALSLQCANKTVDEYQALLKSTFVPEARHFQHLTNVITPQAKDTLIVCKWLGDVKNCQEYFQPIITLFGVCYAFNMLEDQDLFHSEQSFQMNNKTDYGKKPKNEWTLQDGYLNFTKDNYPIHANLYTNSLVGFQVMLRTDLEDVQDVCSQLEGADVADFRVVLGHPAEWPDTVTGDVIRVGMGTELTVSLLPDQIDTSPSLKKLASKMRLCHFPGERKLNIFKTYSKTNCELECSNDLYLKYCKCQIPSLPLLKGSNVSYCTRKVMVDGCGKDFEDAWTRNFVLEPFNMIADTGDSIYCGCLPSCNNLQYDYKLNASPFKPPFTHNNTERFKYSMLNVFYQTSTFQSKRRDELFDLTSFIASCGGLLGVFSGFSLVTLAEVAYFATLRLLCRVRHRRRLSPQ